MATKKYISFERLTEYDSLIKAEIAEGDAGVKSYIGEIPVVEGEETPATVIAYIQKKTSGIATSDNLAALSDRVTDAENAIDDIEADYLTSEDKTELTNAIATAKQEAITAVLGEGTDADFDTLKEVADWILSDTTGAAALQTDVATLKTEMDAVDDRLTTVEGAVATKAEQEALEAAVARIAANESAIAANASAIAAFTPITTGEIESLFA